MSVIAVRLIRFRSDWRGYQRGHVDAELDYGVQAALVQRGIAEWYAPDESAPPAHREQRKNRR